MLQSKNEFGRRNGGGDELGGKAASFIICLETLIQAQCVCQFLTAASEAVNKLA